MLSQAREYRTMSFLSNDVAINKRDIDNETTCNGVDGDLSLLDTPDLPRTLDKSIPLSVGGYTIRD